MWGGGGRRNDRNRRKGKGKRRRRKKEKEESARLRLNMYVLVYLNYALLYHTHIVSYHGAYEYLPCNIIFYPDRVYNGIVIPQNGVVTN